MKSIIKALLRKFGIVAMKRSSGVYLPEDESYRIALELCGSPTPVIIDGGAHTGGAVDAFSMLAPSAEFHCFEPDGTLADELRLKFGGRSNVHIVNAALGESPGKAEFNINASRPTNSLLPVAEGLQPELQELCRTVEQVEVTVTSIDQYLAEMALDRIDVVKLDLQGYDYRALLGARTAIMGVRVVLVEVLFTGLYEGCHLFPDVLQLMADYGFRLYTLAGIHYGSNDELLWADAIFVKDRPRERSAPLAA